MPGSEALVCTSKQTWCLTSTDLLRTRRRGERGYRPRPFCFTSTEARWLIRDGDRGGGRKSEGSTADTARKRPERPWTAARTMEVLRRCLLAIAQRLVHCAIAVSTAVLGQSHKDNVRCTAVEEQPEAKEVQLSQPSSTSLLMISSGLRVQLHLPALGPTWNPYGRGYGGGGDYIPIATLSPSE